MTIDVYDETVKCDINVIEATLQESKKSTANFPENYSKELFERRPSRYASNPTPWFYPRQGVSMNGYIVNLDVINDEMNSHLPECEFIAFYKELHFNNTCVEARPDFIYCRYAGSVNTEIEYTVEAVIVATNCTRQQLLEKGF